GGLVAEDFPSEGAGPCEPAQGRTTTAGNQREIDESADKCAAIETPATARAGQAQERPGRCFEGTLGHQRGAASGGGSGRTAGRVGIRESMNPSNLNALRTLCMSGGRRLDNHSRRWGCFV